MWVKIYKEDNFSLKHRTIYSNAKFWLLNHHPQETKGKTLAEIEALFAAKNAKVEHTVWGARMRHESDGNAKCTLKYPKEIMLIQQCRTNCSDGIMYLTLYSIIKSHVQPAINKHTPHVHTTNLYIWACYKHNKCSLIMNQGGQMSPCTAKLSYTISQIVSFSEFFTR